MLASFSLPCLPAGMTCSKAHAYAKQHPPSWDNYSDEITIAPTKAGSYLLGLESAGPVHQDPHAAPPCRQLPQFPLVLQGPSRLRRLSRKLIFVLRMSLETDNSDLLGTWVRAKYDLEALKNAQRSCSSRRGSSSWTSRACSSRRVGGRAGAYGAARRRAVRPRHDRRLLPGTRRHRSPCRGLPCAVPWRTRSPAGARGAWRHS